MTSHSRYVDAEQLQKLSDEVGRIAGTLARLTIETASARPRPHRAQGVEAPGMSADAVRAVIRARRDRARYFPTELFADPAWDMMLDLLEAEISQRRVAISNLCLAAEVPATTALRWLNAMVDRGFFVRRSDPRDGRRVFVELSKETSQALRQYFADLAPPAGT